MSMSAPVGSETLFLKMSRDTFLNWVHGSFAMVNVGASIVRPSEDVPGSFEILILRRKEYDTSDPNPGMWDLPNGTVEYSDGNIQNALVRIVREKCNLKIASIAASLSEIRYQIPETVPNPDKPGEQMVQKIRVIQVNYRVVVNNFDGLRYNPREHMALYWITPATVEGVGTTRDIRSIMSEALYNAKVHSQRIEPKQKDESTQTDP